MKTEHKTYDASLMQYASLIYKNPSYAYILAKNNWKIKLKYYHLKYQQNQEIIRDTFNTTFV